MNKSIFSAIAAALMLAGNGAGAQESMLLAQTTVTGNITQNQSGWGNSQSISIGNTDSKPAKKGKKGEKMSSTQNDPETGNKQSATSRNAPPVNIAYAVDPFPALKSPHTITGVWRATSRAQSATSRAAASIASGIRSKWVLAKIRLSADPRGRS